jgi:hypothetical protein
MPSIQVLLKHPERLWSGLFISQYFWVSPLVLKEEGRTWEFQCIIIHSSVLWGARLWSLLEREADIGWLTDFFLSFFLSFFTHFISSSSFSIITDKKLRGVIWVFYQRFETEFPKPHKQVSKSQRDWNYNIRRYFTGIVRNNFTSSASILNRIPKSQKQVPKFQKDWNWNQKRERNK